MYHRADHYLDIASNDMQGHIELKMTNVDRFGQRNFDWRDARLPYLHRQTWACHTVIIGHLACADATSEVDGWIVYIDRSFAMFPHTVLYQT